MKIITFIGLFSAALQLATPSSAQNISDIANSTTEAPRASSADASSMFAPMSSASDSTPADWPADALTLHQRALDHFRRGEHERALSEFDAALKLNPHAAEVYLSRGRVHASRKDHARAVEDFDKTISLNAQLAEAFQQRGIVHQGRKDYPQAIKDLGDAIALEPNNPLMLRDRGDLYREMGDYDRAVEDYQSALAADRSKIDAFALGNLLFLQGRFAQSAQTLQQAIKSKPNNHHAVLWRFLAQAKASGLQAALRELSEHTSKMVDYSWPAPVIDYYLGKMDDYSLFHVASSAADAAVKLEQDCQAKFYAAEAKLLKGANDEAIPLLRATQSRCPANPTFFHGASAELKRLGQL